MSNNIDQMYTINNSDNLRGLSRVNGPNENNSLNFNPEAKAINDINLDNALNELNLDNLNDNFGNEQRNNALNLLDDNQVENPYGEEAIDEVPAEDERKDKEEEMKEEEVKVAKVDEQEKFLLQAQYENSKNVKAQKEIETEGDFENIISDESADNDKVNF